jgi:hypothetical protein
MKNNFKMGLLALSLCFVFSAQAQIKYGVKGGFNASSISGFDEFLKFSTNEEGNSPANINSKYKSGFHLGLMFQYNFESKFFLQPELLFSNQGSTLEAKINYEGVKYSDSETSTINYLQLPIYAGYKFNAGPSLDIIAGVGPYLAYGVHASDLFGSSDPGTFDVLKRFDAGLSAMAGVEYDKLQLTLGFDFGLVDAMDLDGWKTVKNLTGLSSICTRNIKVSVGYFF